MTLDDQKSNSADSLNLRVRHQGSAAVHPELDTAWKYIEIQTLNTLKKFMQEAFTHWQPYKTYTDLSIVLSIVLSIYCSIILSFNVLFYHSIFLSIDRFLHP